MFKVLFVLGLVSATIAVSVATLEKTMVLGTTTASSASPTLVPTPTSFTPIKKVVIVRPTTVPTVQPLNTQVNCQIGNDWYIQPSSEACTQEQNKYWEVKSKLSSNSQIVYPTMRPYPTLIPVKVNVYPTSKPLSPLPQAKPIDGTIHIIENPPAPTVPVGYGY